MFKKYEKFKQSLKSKNLSPKEYQKLVKKMDGSERREKKEKKVKNREKRNGAPAPFFLLKNYKKRLLFVLSWCIIKKIK